MAWYESRGARLHYRDDGHGPVVVLLHGVWMSSQFFRHQTSEAFGGVRVIAPDFRGHGRSDKPLDGHTVAGYAADLKALLDELDTRDVTLVGWSMGAFVAWEYLRQESDRRVTGLVVVDESASDFAWPGWDHGVITVETLRELNAGIQADQRAVMEHFAPAMFAAELPTADQAWIVEEMCQVPPAVASAILLDQTLADYRESLSELTIDTLVCFGRDAKLLSVAAGEDLVTRIAGARLQVFENSSHCPFLEEPAAFNASIAEFVARRRTTSA
jgi:pimeloyl-ACP methyl ester carboxylesterase